MVLRRAAGVVWIDMGTRTGIGSGIPYRTEVSWQPGRRWFCQWFCIHRHM